MSKKKYLFLSLSLFSFFSFSQNVDPSLLSQLSPEQIEAAKQAVANQNITDLEIQDLPEVKESLVINDEYSDESNEELITKKCNNPPLAIMFIKKLCTFSFLLSTPDLAIVSIAGMISV